MRLLLDTHIFLWAITDGDRLTVGARRLLLDADEVYVSAASVWEIAIKAALGKIQGDVDQMVAAIGASGFLELPVIARHAAFVAQIPAYHRDPFDRLLVAQAMTEPMALVTTDAFLARYGALVKVV